MYIYISIDNITSEIIIYGGSQMVITMTLLCQKICIFSCKKINPWVMKEWPYEWAQSLIIPIPKKDDPIKFNNYKTISLISHPSKIMLRIILNRLNPISEYIIAEEKAGLRKKRSTIEQILNDSNLYISSHITICKSRNISLQTKIPLYKSQILSILLYGCETWTLSERLERRITAFDHKAYKRNMGITYRERKTNYYVYQIIVEGICQVEHLLSKVKIRKMSYFGHTIRHDSLNKTVIQGCVFSKRRRGKSIQNWMDNIVEWAGSYINLTQLREATQNRDGWNRTCVAASHIPLRSTD